MTETIEIELTPAEAIGVANMLDEGNAKPEAYRQVLAEKVREQYYDKTGGVQ